MTTEKAKLAARFKEAREYIGMSQQEVAEALGIPRSAVSLIESGQRGVGAVELKAFAKLYQTSVAALSGEEEATPPSDIALLAKKVSELSEEDREELMRFSDFLKQRSKR
jgi:transcriptional regulator with XRE-family HTH domain